MKLFCQHTLLLLALVFLFEASTSRKVGATPKYVPFKRCDAGGATDVTKVHFLKIGECTAMPCQLKKGTTQKMAITFTTSSPITSGEMKVFGVLSGTESLIAFPLDEKKADACLNGVACGISAPATRQTYSTSFDIQSHFPEVSAVASRHFLSQLMLPIQLKLMDQDNKERFCVTTVIQLVRA